ncbi:MAG: PEGA domain-containing protein [Myxococcales bacterium]|nr:PEGA domain-containing protein [Myxococcales bacterium]
MRAPQLKSFWLLFAAFLTLISHNAVAQAKPTIAVLALEVIDNGNVDKETTRAAQHLAQELRVQAKRPDGEFTFAPNSEKDLLELKLLSGCSDEGRDCMAEIGADLGADRLLYGKLERKQRGYQVSLKLLNTKTKQMEKATSELIPAEDLHSNKINKWSRSLYVRLIGVPESGTLSIDANVDKATIYIDGSVATTLRDGSAKVLGLSEGTHTVTIEADGYVRYEAEVAVAAGETEKLSTSLSAQSMGGGSGGNEGDGGGIWKIGFAGGVLLTGAMATGWAYNGLRVWGELKDAKVDAWDALKMNNPDAYGEIAGGSIGTGESCGRAGHADITTDNNGALEAFLGACQDGEDAASQANLFIAGTAVAALATAYLGYQGWVVHGGSKTSKERRARAKRKKRNLVVTPHIGERSVGAGLSLEF